MRYLLGWLLVLGCFATTSSAADPVPAREVILKHLMKWYAKHDASSDAFLDRDELARAFHGKLGKTWKDPEPRFDPDAPFDKKPGELPRSVLQRPDFKLLAALDTDDDGKISKAEFELWASDYAGELEKFLQNRARTGPGVSDGYLPWLKLLNEQTQLPLPKQR